MGRQLFVDDFLIHETDLSRSYHSARMHEGEPVVDAAGYARESAPSVSHSRLKRASARPS